MSKSMFIVYHLSCSIFLFYLLTTFILIHESYISYFGFRAPSPMEDHLFRSPMKMLFGGGEADILFNLLITPVTLFLYACLKNKNFYGAHCLVSLMLLIFYFIFLNHRQGMAFCWDGGGGGKSIIVTHAFFFVLFCQGITVACMQLAVFWRFKEMFNDLPN